LPKGLFALFVYAGKDVPAQMNLTRRREATKRRRIRLRRENRTPFPVNAR
jgi:hypothetical protein